MIRLDDCRSGVSWSFDDAVASMRACSLDEVTATVAEAQGRATNHGEWVVIAIAYESAPAFDEALRAHPAPPAGTPYVWWQSFRDRSPCEPWAATPGDRNPPLQRRPNRMPFVAAVEAVRERIAVGDLYQANISDRFEGTLSETPLEFYGRLLTAQTCEFGAYIEMDERIVASVSPELFFDWNDDRIMCRPMKGTAPRHPRPARDAGAAAELLRSEKDRAENVMIVDLVRNDLGRLARTGTVDVTDLLRLERYETVWQLTSTVTASIDPASTLVDVLTATFPCGSVTGAPKVSALSTIVDLEAEPRGIYCGAIGVLAPDEGSRRAVFSVPIRTAIIDPRDGTFEYSAGAGITWSSDAGAEDREVLAKTRVLSRQRPTELLETMRLDAAGLRHVDLHLARLATSAAWFGFPLPTEAIVEALDALVAPHADAVCRVRLLVTADGGFSVSHEPLDQSAAEPVRLAIDDQVTRSDDPLCCHKTTARDHYTRARARHPDADDVILVNELGHVIETTVANLAIHTDGRWWCPPLDDGGLAGVGRRVALDNGELHTRSFTPDDVRGSEALAVVSALRGWRRARLI